MNDNYKAELNEIIKSLQSRDTYTSYIHSPSPIHVLTFHRIQFLFLFILHHLYSSSFKILFFLHKFKKSICFTLLSGDHFLTDSFRMHKNQKSFHTPRKSPTVIEDQHGVDIEPTSFNILFQKPVKKITTPVKKNTT